MGRAFRVVAYLAFLASFAWLFAFVGDFFGRVFGGRTVDEGLSGLCDGLGPRRAPRHVAAKAPCRPAARRS